jgi:hypothetical protein
MTSSQGCRGSVIGSGADLQPTGREMAHVFALLRCLGQCHRAGRSSVVAPLSEHSGTRVQDVLPDLDAVCSQTCVDRTGFALPLFLPKAQRHPVVSDDLGSLCVLGSAVNLLGGRPIRPALSRDTTRLPTSATLRGQIRVRQSTVSAETSCPSRQSGLDWHRRPAWISIQPLPQCHRPGRPIPPRAPAPVRRH